MSCLMTKPKQWHVRPTKTQISLGIRPVWSESLLSAWRKLGALATHSVQSEDSDQTGQMPRLIWVFARRTFHFVGFVMRQLKSRWFSGIWSWCKRKQKEPLKSFNDLRLKFFWFISVFESTGYLKFAKLQYVSSGFHCRVITGSLMGLCWPKLRGVAHLLSQNVFIALKGSHFWFLFLYTWHYYLSDVSLLGSVSCLLKINKNIITYTLLLKQIGSILFRKKIELS